MPETLAFRKILRQILEPQAPFNVRQAFYQGVVHRLVDKAETGYGQVQRNLLAMRRGGVIPYSRVVDLHRQLRGYRYWAGVEDFIADTQSLYRRDLRRENDVRVEFWIEKSTLCGFLDPIICTRWGLSYWAGGGFTSETALYKAGTAIAELKKPTFVYVLSDFDPSGEDIAGHIKYGSKTCPGGIDRFTGGVPVYVEQLAVTKDQIRQWNLPTRPVVSKGKELTTRKARFIEEHGDDAVELDAIPPNLLRDLIDATIAQHCDRRKIENLRSIEESERELLPTWISLGRAAHADDMEFQERQFEQYLSEQGSDDDLDLDEGDDDLGF